MALKTSEWRPGPTVCRCCLSEGCYKDIATEYFWMGKREVYAEMLLDTLNLTIPYAQTGGPSSHSRLICEPCISRLRDATDFKRQVKECEQAFQQCLNPSLSTNVDVLVSTEEPEKESVKVEIVKQEDEPYEDDDFADNTEFLDDDDDLDDQPLMTLATKVPKKENVDETDLLDNAKPVKRKSTAKTKASPAKKAKAETKPTTSKPKPEKKKKEMDWVVGARHNARVVLRYATAYPFRIPSNSLLCVFCCDTYDDPQEYRDHMNKEHSTFNVRTAFMHIHNNGIEYLKVDCADLKCRLCGIHLDSLEEIAKHLLVAHGKNINTNVEVGMQMFKLGSERWVCALCNVKVPSLRELSRHTSTHYHKYTCETCGKSYVNQDNLNKHILYGHSDTAACIKCKKQFPSKEARRQHILISQKCWPLRCPHCSERFRNKKDKVEHCSVAHGEGPKEYKCPECPMVFNKWSPYRSHFVLMHTSNVHTCSFCGLQFDHKKYLEDHIVLHTKEKKFTCPVCAKTFARKKNLKQHSWIHSEYKRFECKPCNKQFNQRVSWRTHMKSYHPDLVDF